ncbi:hypothetical protein FQN57_003932 [Myotisia sp. PD_48]|nr:hypothetical protein FQN57_003932 [Myotisia sp. PD_48]
MTRPHIIRADTLDLQNHQAPSAQDHSKRNPHPSTTLAGHHAPHRDESIRIAERETLDELARGPMGSEDESQAPSPKEILDRYRDQEDSVDDYNGLVSEQMAHNSANEGSADDDDDDLDLEDDLMDKISSSPSIDDEDIDFEFVYALHTFIATVEGQANAIKGDTMVLLDDSNSYWWLVRVVKDGSIGYLPAEHIETPTERLARLNKHRNIDLSATMLGDNAEKSKNPLRKAMRRRNAKAVTFADPIFSEASITEYSSESEDEDQPFLEEDEEEEEEEERQDGLDSSRKEEQGTSRTSHHDLEKKDADMVVEPLRTRSQTQKELTTLHEERADSRELEEEHENEELSISEVYHGRSRNGVVRNTDSFYKDDTVETKKISLTPNLLRDDSVGTAQTFDQKEIKGRASSESFDKALGLDKGKDDKKRKDKKPGMLSGLFKRRDRKSKALEDDEDPEKTSEEFTRTSTSTTSIEVARAETPPSKPQTALQRQPSKLQKAPPGETSGVKGDETHASQDDKLSGRSPSPLKQTLQGQTNTSHQPGVRSPEAPKPANAQPGIYGHIEREISPPKSAQASASHSPVELTHPPSGIRLLTTLEPMKPTGTQSTEPTSEPTDQPPVSPFDDIFAENKPSSSRQPLTTTSPQQQSSYSPSSSPEALEESISKSSTATWNEVGLRAYLDDGSDIRDLLVIVHDNTNVPAAGPDHPVTGALFKDESKALSEMSARLDEMLSSWLSRSAAVSK